MTRCRPTRTGRHPGLPSLLTATVEKDMTASSEELVEALRESLKEN